MSVMRGTERRDAGRVRGGRGDEGEEGGSVWLENQSRHGKRAVHYSGRTFLLKVFIATHKSLALPVRQVRKGCAAKAARRTPAWFCRSIRVFSCREKSSSFASSCSLGASKSDEMT